MSLAVLNQPLTEQEAIELAKEIERTESALKQMKETLKKYVEQNGEINAGDKIWGFSEYISWKFEAEQLRKLAEGIVLDGKNPWEYLSISSTSVKRLGWDENILMKYGNKRVSKRFVSRKTN